MQGSGAYPKGASVSRQDTWLDGPEPARGQRCYRRWRASRRPRSPTRPRSDSRFAGLPDRRQGTGLLQPGSVRVHPRVHAPADEARTRWRLEGKDSRRGSRRAGSKPARVSGGPRRPRGSGAPDDFHGAGVPLVGRNDGAGSLGIRLWTAPAGGQVVSRSDCHARNSRAELTVIAECYGTRPKSLRRGEPALAVARQPPTVYAACARVCAVLMGTPRRSGPNATNNTITIANVPTTIAIAMP
jgi:hypothetical protein